MLVCIVTLPRSCRRVEFWMKTLAVTLIQYVCGRPQRCLLINGVT